ncbi:type VI secretion system PAAR protein [Motilimonas pumila]|uniref:Type VI secretion system PAAR protein n=1 Tax=Motilimonas pumila TaxID=2303987 RepID=A0A418Y9E1_9GAMM|nr:type VI secretion system PAAR protein [Motilimonas pumila]RJG37160.1 type VI secretion system PAAR protein [Motilimonas pumila]RJG41894.1 type VI secretion system PAAR protein [Motilimonas pumila]
MGNAAKLGDIGTAHDGFPPTPITAGSGTVKVDGIPLARKGDPLAPHSKPKHPPHGRSISGGSGTVFADGKPVAKTGDGVSCGGVVIGGGTVNVG